MAIKRTTGKSVPARRPGPPPKKSNPLPLVIGGVVALVALVAIIAVAMSNKTPKTKGGGDAVARGPDVPLPEYKKAESEGRAKVNHAITLLKEKATALAALKPEQKVDAMKDLAKALQDKKEGTVQLETANVLIDTYNRDSGKALKKIDLAALERDWASATNRLVGTLEKDGQFLCERGYQSVQSLKDTWSDESQPGLKAKLKAALDDLTHGMNLYDWANQLADVKFDATKYGQARKLVGNKYNGMK